ncbi:MAG: dTMP kinase [Candidatus Latescibacterota bacterium]
MTQACGSGRTDCGISLRNPEAESRKDKGVFITFEGIDQCGKSTQAQRLVKTLIGSGYEVVLTREPGGTALSERIRAIVLDGNTEGMTRWTELLLMMASRAQHTEEVILPALRQGKVVVCDRYSDSTVAYQGGGRGLDLETIAVLNRIAALGLAPDLTILLDVSVAEAARRRGHALIAQDRMEQETSDFHQRVRTGYLELARRDPGRFLVLDGTMPVAAIEEQIGKRVMEELKQGTPTA